MRPLNTSARRSCPITLRNLAQCLQWTSAAHCQERSVHSSRRIQYAGRLVSQKGFWEGTMKLPRRQFLHLAAGAAAVPTVSRIVRAQAYPTRPVRMIDLPWRCERHFWSCDRSMAVRKVGPAIHRREPAGRQRKYRHPGGRACTSGRLFPTSDRSGPYDQRNSL